MPYRVWSIEKENEKVVCAFVEGIYASYLGAQKKIRKMKKRGFKHELRIVPLDIAGFKAADYSTLWGRVNYDAPPEERRAEKLILQRHRWLEARNVPVNSTAIKPWVPGVSDQPAEVRMTKREKLAQALKDKHEARTKAGHPTNKERRYQPKKCR